MSAPINYCPKADQPKSTRPGRSGAPADATGVGRKLPVRFGRVLPEKRTASSDPT
jgi:hypothetical protein